jgi:hypothetical protein
MQPAAAHKLCTCGTQFPRLQAEKCFLARTGRARKLTSLDFAVATAKLYEVL